MIPEGWRTFSLGEVVTFRSGGTPSKQTPSYWGGDFPWVSAKDLKKHYIDSAELHLTKEGREHAKIAPLGAVLILVRGMTLLKDIPIGYVSSEVAFNQDIKALITNPHIDSLFISFLLVGRKQHIRSLVNTANHGTGRLDTYLLSSLPLSLPPLQEQRRIAEILSTWDRAIEVTEKLIANSEAQKKALMQKLLTGKERLPGFDGEWDVFRLDELAVIKMGSSPKSENYNEIGIGLPLLQGNADILEGKSSPRVYTSVITQVCEPRDILLSVRAPVGSIAISEHEACIGRGFAAIKANEEVSHKLLLELLRNLKDYWLKLSQGSTFESINSKDVKSLNIMLPKRRPEQEALSELFSSAQSEIESRKKFVEELRVEKSALMQQLLTGKRRVKIDKEAAA